MVTLYDSMYASCSDHNHNTSNITINIATIVIVCISGKIVGYRNSSIMCENTIGRTHC